MTDLLSPQCLPSHPPTKEPAAIPIREETMTMMIEKTNHLLLFLSISSLLFLPFSEEAHCHPPVAPLQVEDVAVEEICRQTSYPSLCISTLTPFPSELDSPTAILEMAVKASLNSTEAALAEATRLLSDPSTPASEKPLITDCQEIYSDVIQDLQEAVKAGADGDHGLFDSILSASIDSYENCDNVFAPFNRIDERLSQMASNCLAIASLVS